MAVIMAVLHEGAGGRHCVEEAEPEAGEGSCQGERPITWKGGKDSLAAGSHEEGMPHICPFVLFGRVLLCIGELGSLQCDGSGVCFCRCLTAPASM